MSHFFRLAIIALLLFPLQLLATSVDKAVCDETLDDNMLKGGWYFWEPYQYNQLTPTGYKLTGMDIDLSKRIAKRAGIDISFVEIDWDTHQQQLADGVRDIAAGATYTEERAKFAYFSLPYRFEENSLFVRQDTDKDLTFDTVSEFLAQIRLQHFALGVTKGFAYADQQINIFISDDSNEDIIHPFNNDSEALDALMQGEIDGFIADRVVGAALILQRKEELVSIKEVQLSVKTPIHLMFSKKTVPLGVVDKINSQIRQFKPTNEYKDIVKTYLYPVMILQTIDTYWFYLIGVIGTIAFAISGVAIAANDNATLFQTLLFAALPSVGGVTMRDVLVNRNELGIFLTPSYMYSILIVVLVGFSTVRLLEFYNKHANQDILIFKFWDNILVVGDAIGQAAFIVTGVSIAIMARIEPIELWGPFFAFLTANGGGIIRDVIRTKNRIVCLTGPINVEVGIIWGFIFSVYLDINSYDPDPSGIRNTVIIVAIGSFTTRMLAYYLNIPNIKFRADSETDADVVAEKQAKAVLEAAIKEEEEHSEEQERAAASRQDQS